MIEKLTKFQKNALIVLCILISSSFLFVYYHICNDKYSFGLFLRTLVTVAVSFFVYALLTKINPFLEKHYKKIIACFLGIMLIVQIIFGYFLEITPQWDFANIYEGAVSWAEHGTFPNPSDYFFYFPNNLGGMAFLAVCFKFAVLFGISQYAMVAAVVNAILNVLMMLVCFYICKKLVSVKSGIFVLFIFMVSLPSYIGAAVFYTDVLTMLFPVLLYFLYLKFRETKNIKAQAVYLILMGLVAWLGMSIKFTVAIVLIAIAIELILRLEFKRLLILAGAVAIIYSGCNYGFYEMIYSRHLDRELSETKKLPPIHWIMMGLQGDADYSAEDIAFSNGFDSPEKRNAAIMEEIGTRISNYGAAGLFEFATRKAVKCFGDGTYELSAFFYHGMVRETALNDYVTGEGEHYEDYEKFCSGVYLGFFLLMILAGYYRMYEYRKNGSGSPSHITPMVSVFGLLLFLIMWEAHARYITNYIPMIYICAATGMEELSKIRVKISLSQTETPAKQ